MFTFIFLGNFGTSSPSKQNFLSRLQRSNEHTIQSVRQSRVLSCVTTTLKRPTSPALFLMVLTGWRKPRKAPKIYLLNQQHANFNSSTELQSLEHDLLQRCAVVDRATNNGTIEVSNINIASGIFTSELKLVNFPSFAGDLVVYIEYGIALFYLVNTITKCLNEKGLLPKSASINAVFCNDIHFPSYVDVKSIEMKLTKVNLIEFSGTIGWA